jgi:hypothetical protein
LAYGPVLKSLSKFFLEKRQTRWYLPNPALFLPHHKGGGIFDKAEGFTLPLSPGRGN